MSIKNYKTLTWILTIAINGLIALSFFLPKFSSLKAYNFSVLPQLNAVLNGLTFISLIFALIAIKRKNMSIHKLFIFLAFSFTSFFLISYLIYHFTTPSTKYSGSDLFRYIYYFILLTHILLAIIIVPLALISIGLGLNNKIVEHRKITRWSMPIWLYVSLTGVIVYLMISPFYLK
ncbi:DUF420 domain-containing protein [Mucilaginibacter ginsenosidivorax]|uniref:DUF420 domain-containing protein n=1 Tax=Mucilaginibacter ginsenosidivorax TaxID=862126 RepID=A0A5B8W582_9SPHI|nr:DUF420 domain-containing protein [Mucilaginibacter ginsenosidivorax]